ncbi:methyl-accepting chemotaxis protein [Chitinibacteraceae bacterium HSL-7]
MTLKTKAWGLTVIVLVFLLGMTAVGLYVLREAALKDDRSRVTQLTKSAYSTVVQLENLAASGKLSDDQAKQIATQILRENKYHTSEYCWVADEKMTFVATPLDPQLHGTSFNDFKDAQGKPVGSIVQAALDKSGGQLTDYTWQSERDGNVVDILSMAVRSPRWGWAVGNGLNTVEADARFWANARWQVIVCLVLSAVVGALLILAASKMIATLGGEPEDVVRMVSRVADGDLAPNERTIQAGERTILGSVERMRAALRVMVEEIQRDSGALASHSAQISSSSRDISVAAGHQTEATSSMAAAMEELTVSINHISDNTTDTEQASKQATQLAAEGVDQVNSATSAMSTISDSVAQASTQIRSLDAKAREISSIAAVIKDIAEQTNLLALNAAIEAARAGEQGRGFAVVADEVRKLAERTSSATIDIEKMLASIQRETDSVVQVMDQALPQVQSGVDLARNVTDSLNQIHDGARRTLARLHEMTTSTREQSEASNSIASRVEDISRMVEETTASIHRAAHTAEEIEHIATSLNQCVRRFRL